MAALRVAVRRAASNPFCTKRFGRGDTGLYGGDPPPFPSGGRWAALMARRVGTPSTLAARPARFLGTGAGAVADKTHDLRFLGTGAGAIGDKTGETLLLGTGGKIADPLFLSTGGKIAGGLCFPATGDKIAGPLLLDAEGKMGGGSSFSATGDKIAGPLFLGAGGKIGGGPCFPATGDKIAGPLLLGTSGKIVGGPCFPATGRIADHIFLGTGDKTGGSRFLHTVGGAAGSLQIAGAITLPGRRGLWPATSTFLSNSRNGVLLKPLWNPYFVSAIRPLSTWPSKDDPDLFSKLWAIEMKVGVCAKLIEDSHKSVMLNAQTIMAMMKHMRAEQARIFE